MTRSAQQGQMTCHTLVGGGGRRGFSARSGGVRSAREGRPDSAVLERADRHTPGRKILVRTGNFREGWRRSVIIARVMSLRTVIRIGTFGEEMKRLYYSNGNSEVNGPISESDFKALYSAGAVTNKTMICVEGTDSWCAAEMLFDDVKPKKFSKDSGLQPPPLPEASDDHEKIAPSSWALGFIVTCILAGAIFGPIGYFVEKAELSGKIDPPKWVGEAIAFSFIGFMLWVTGASAAFFHAKRNGKKWP